MRNSYLLLFFILGASSFSQITVPHSYGADASRMRVVVATGSCGGYLAPGVYKAFMCHNLGADTSLDPHTPVQGIYGNYYQWGSSEVVANASTAASAIAGWNTTAAADGAWADGSKTATDPCPAGYRVPTIAQWAGLAANNTVSRTGSWANDGNFTTALHFGTSTSKTLTVPAAGTRSLNNGRLNYRGFHGRCWSSTENGPFASYLNFNSRIVNTIVFDRTLGLSVRCVSE